MVNIIGGRNAAKKIAQADSVAVLGLGRFGTSLALELMSTGASVMGIDSNEETVQSLNGELTQVVKADVAKLETLEQLSLADFDRVVVAIGSHLQSSILACSKLLKMGVPEIWAKAHDDQHGLILEQLGVHHIVYPDKDMGRRVAHLVRGSMMDYVEVERGYAMVKMTAPKVLQGLRLGDSNLRKHYGVTIAAHADADGKWQNADAATVLRPGERILVLGPTKDTEAFGQLPG
ncbi:potassium channel family protein [Glutamicibacter sp. X7]